jgi:hypothetical protein
MTDEKERRAKAVIAVQKWRHKNGDHVREWYRNHKQILKHMCMQHYGNRCNCCGETHIEFLTIDHINNDGSIDRKRGRSGATMYAWLKKNNYPEGYQVLCWNCNEAKSRYGICPHQKEIDG